MTYLCTRTGKPTAAGREAPAPGLAGAEGARSGLGGPIRPGGRASVPGRPPRCRRITRPLADAVTRSAPTSGIATQRRGVPLRTGPAALPGDAPVTIIPAETTNSSRLWRLSCAFIHCGAYLLVIRRNVRSFGPGPARAGRRPIAKCSRSLWTMRNPGPARLTAAPNSWEMPRRDGGEDPVSPLREARSGETMAHGILPWVRSRATGGFA